MVWERKSSKTGNYKARRILGHWRLLGVAAALFLVAAGVGTFRYRDVAAGFTPPPTAGGEPASSALPLEAQYAVSAAIGRDDERYHAVETASGVELDNPAHGLRLVCGRDGATLQANALVWKIGLVSWGYGKAHVFVERGDPAVRGNRVEIDRGDVTEWYVNGPFGLQQGFTVAEAPTEHQDGPLVLELAAPDEWAARIDPDGRGLSWCDPNGTATLSYTGLIAVDARGEPLPARLEADDGFLFVCVDDAGATYPVTIDPWIHTAKLTASDGAMGDCLGYSVAISGDTVVVGAYNDDYNAPSSGSAYVFVKPGGGWASGTETAKLTASDGAEYDWFGCSVAIDGDTVVVGAHGDDDNGSDSGSAYVFVKPGGGWASTSAFDAKLTASDGAADDWFGSSVAISGDTVVVGVWGDDDNGSDSGSAYVFVKPGGGWATGTETAKLTASDGGWGAEFGFSVAIDGDTVVAGAYGDDDNESYSGSAYVFVKPGGGWATGTETAKLTASDGAWSDYLGYSVAISGGTVVVGAWGDDDNGGASGSAYVFVKPGGGWATGAETGRLTASDGAGGDRFGYSVAISGDTVVVGAYGDDDNDWYSGSAYVFVKPGGGWVSMTETGKLTASDGAENDYFGFSVAVGGDTVIVGAYRDDSGRGSAYVFAEAGIMVAPTTGLHTTEAGGTATFDVSAETAPMADVTIPLNSSDTTEGTLPASVVLPAGSTTPVAVTVTGVDDAFVDGDVGYTIVTGDPTSTDAAYDALGPDDSADVSVTNHDDDVAGILVTPTSGLITTETGGTATFDVSAATPPADDVTVPLSSSDTTEGTVPASVALPAGNTDPVTVTVTGVDDAIVDGGVAYTIVTGDPTSGDGAYDALGTDDVTDVSVTNHDDDVARIIVTPTSGLITTEAGGTATFDVSAATPLTADVMIPLLSSDTTEGTTSASVVLPAGSSDPVAVTVTGVDDAFVDGDVGYTIVTCDATSTDAAYDALGSDDVADVSVTNQDDDVAGIIVTPTSGLITTEAGGTATFDVSAATPPTDDVTVPLSSSDTTEGTVSASVVLPADITDPVTVTVTGVDDAIVDGDVAYTIVTGDPTSGDGAYDALGPDDVADVSVMNHDDEGPGTDTATVFRVDPTGGVFADGTLSAAAFESGSADVAEWVPVSEPVEAGDVLALDPDHPGAYRLSRTARSPLVAGVVSTAPGVTLGGQGGTGRALLALTGIVPVKVTNEGGPIACGDLLVSSSTPGHAMRWDGGGSSALIGKALEPMSDTRGLILGLLTSH